LLIKEFVRVELIKVVAVLPLKSWAWFRLQSMLSLQESGCDHKFCRITRSARMQVDSCTRKAD